MTRPFIQIGDEYREMTDEELAAYEKVVANAPQIENFAPIDPE